MKRRGQHVPQREQAVREQAQADRVRATVERVEHFRTLQRKFGPRWDGLCPAKKHGLDYEGQPCDLCAKAGA